MKKLYKVLATAFAMALVFTAPQMTMTTHAFGFNEDAPEHDYAGDSDFSLSDPDAGSSSSSGSSNGGSSSYSEPSHSEQSYSEPSYSESYQDSEPSYTENASSGNDVASFAPAVKKNPNDLTMGVEGGQRFRTVMAGDHKSFQVFHCGISKATFTVGNADGTGVAYKTAALAKGEDNLWYINIAFDETVDTTGYAIGVTKGDASYLYTELGVSGIKINGTLALSTVLAK